MKRVYTSQKHKRHRIKTALRSLKRKRKKKPKIKKQKRETNSQTKSVRRRKASKVKNIKAPSNFSFINNTEETIEYFEKAHKELKSKHKINFDISDISTLTTDAIAVQIAKIKDTKFHFRSGIMGNEPKNENLKRLFQQSGFYEYVNTTVYRPLSNNKLLIHKVTKNSVEPKLAKEACLVGIRHTFKNEEIFEPLYDIIIEIMQNTNNHAGSTKGKYDWWLHVYNHPESSKTSYSFLDLGIGIFESLPVQNFKRNVLQFIGLRSNLDLVEKLFAGEIKSRTARPERGKGIPQVFECSQDNAFEKFILISNDIYADLKTKEYRLLNKKFEGTLFYWELIDNKSIENGN